MLREADITVDTIRCEAIQKNQSCILCCNRVLCDVNQHETITLLKDAGRCKEYINKNLLVHYGPNISNKMCTINETAKCIYAHIVSTLKKENLKICYLCILIYIQSSPH